MIRATLDAGGFAARLDKLALSVRRQVINGVAQAHADIVSVTPEDTGFLRASWYVQHGNTPARHPSKPSYSIKRQHDRGRPFRRIKGRDVFVGYDTVEAWGFDVNLPKPESAFTDIYEDTEALIAAIRARAARLSNPFPDYFAIINTAPYAEYVDHFTPFSDTAAMVAQAAIRRSVGRVRDRDAGGRFTAFT